MGQRIAVGAAVTVMVMVAACGPSANGPKPAPTPAATPTAPSPSAIDRVSLKEVAEARVEIPAPDWLATGFGSLWVKQDDGAVVRISPKGKVEATIDADVYEPPVCQGIGVSEKAVWACASGGTIIRIDPETNDIAATIEVPKINEQGRLTASGDQVWMLTGDGDELAGLSEASNRLGDPISLGTFCTDVSDQVVEGLLWIGCASEGVLLRVDLDQRKVTGTVKNLPLATNISVGHDVWVGFDEGVARIDPHSLEVTLLQGAVHPDRIRATSDDVWIREAGENFLSQLDPSTGAVRRVITGDDLTTGGDVLEFDGALWATAYDDDTVVRLAP